jgi:hypothetical protein
VSQRSLALALVLGAGLLLASGCGSDDDGDDADGVEAEDTPTTTAGADDTAPDTASDDGEGEGAEGSASGDVDACAALAGVDIEALVGEPVMPPDGSTDMMGAACNVDPVSESSAGLRLIVSDQEPEDNYANQQETFGVDTEVEGLGDKAFHTGPYLFVLAGDQLVFLQVVQDAATGAGVDDADLEAAMQTVLDNLAG